MLSPNFKLKKVPLFFLSEAKQMRYSLLVAGNRTTVQWFDCKQQNGYIFFLRPLIEEITRYFVFCNFKSRRSQTAITFGIRCFITVLCTFDLFNLALLYNGLIPSNKLLHLLCSASNLEKINHLCFMD